MTDCANRGYRRLFDDEALTFGLYLPISTSTDAVPDENVDEQVELAQYASESGFDALWVRDVPTYWPRFGDAGQLCDPLTCLSYLAAHTEDVALATGSIALPLRHPLHVAKAAASIDRLSDGRLVLGIASGDRPPEFAAFGVDAEARDERFRESVRTIRAVWRERFPELETSYGTLSGDLGVVPTPTTEAVPLLVTGRARQSLDWIAAHADGWLYYQLPEKTLRNTIDEWHTATDGRKPYAQAMVTIPAADGEAEATPVHQGFRAGVEWFREYFSRLEDYGVDHVAVGFRGADRPIRECIDAFASEVIERV